jgi:hypothetical protein
MSSFKPSRPPKAQNTVSKTDEGHYFEVIPTPSPRELAFRVKEFCATFNPTEVPVIGTSYGDSTFLSVRPRIQLEGFKDYLLLNIQRDGDFLWFKYAKNKTESEKNNSPFRVFFTNRRYTWPAVLQDLYFVQTTEFQQAVFDGTTTQTQPSYFPRYAFRPAASVSTICMVEQFLSPTPWDRVNLNHTQPIPTGVHGSWVGLEFDFQECLHPDIIITEKVPGFSIVQGVGVVSPLVPRNPLRKIIPKTNFTAWTQFVYDDGVEPSDGYWLRERVTYFPPIIPRPSFV